MTFYDKFVQPFGKTALHYEAFKKYNAAMDSITELMEASDQVWGLMNDRWFSKVRKGYFIAGGVCGIVLSGAVYCGHKFIKAKCSSQKSEEKG